MSGRAVERSSGSRIRFVKPLLAFMLFVAFPLSAQVVEGDRHYAARHEGAQGARAKSGPIDAAIAAYEKAVVADPNDLEAHWKLLRALRFRGGFTTASNEEKKRVYGAAKSAGGKALAAVSRRLAAKGVDTAEAKEADIAAATRGIPGIGEIYLWDAVNWGEWALAYGKIAAARQGAADRIRREATIALLIDPRIEAGAPARVLGRLHDQTPRIPFLTGWASSKEAVRFLEQSLKVDPTNKLTMVFLAEVLAGDSDTKPRAQQLLRTVVSAPNHPEYAVEDAAAVEDARRMLGEL